MGIGERHPPMVQHIGRRDRGFAIIGRGMDALRIGVDEGLLVDPPDARHHTDIEAVLGAARAGMLAFERAVGVLLRLGRL